MGCPWALPQGLSASSLVVTSPSGCQLGPPCVELLSTVRKLPLHKLGPRQCGKAV